jgi:hypothetical protein
MTLSTSIIVTLVALSSPFIHPVSAAKPASLEISSQNIVDSYASSDYSSPSQTDTSEAVAGTNAGSSSSSSVDPNASASTSAATAQWFLPKPWETGSDGRIEINTPMGKITECSTIMLSWSSAGIKGPLEIDLVSATTGDIITVDSNIDPSTTQSYKWTVAAPADTYYLEGNAADFSSLIYSGNFTVSDGTSTACMNDKQPSASGSSSVASGSAASQSVPTVTVKPSTTGSTFSSGAGRVAVPGMSVVSFIMFAAFYL